MNYFLDNFFSMLSYLLVTLFEVVPIIALISLIIYVFKGGNLYNNAKWWKKYIK